MSTIYIQEPATSGKVVLVTSFGDIDVELWCKECPLACRNFIQLCMEGYYDNVTFHRLVRGFIIQAGDPTGTGEGGESVFDKPFKDEFHQRLRFNRRGLVGCASSQPNDNNSQFFITLDRADELTNKHTLFGKVTGNTIFNVLKMGELPTDENDQPEEPPRIIRTEVLSNPFDDIVPRKLAPRVPQQDEESEAKRRRRRKARVKAVKDFKLMSFGEEAEEDEQVIHESTKKLGKLKSSHDVLQDERLASARDSEAATRSILEADADDVKKEARARVSKGTRRSGADDAKPREPEHVKAAREAEERLQTIKREADELKRELKKAKSGHDGDGGAGEGKDAKPMSEASAFLSQERAQLLKEGKSRRAKKRGDRESETLALLAKFRNKLSRAGSGSASSSSGGGSGSGSGSALAPAVSDTEAVTAPPGVDDLSDEVADTTWMQHKLTNEVETAPKGIDPELDPNSLDIYDPRNPLNIRRRKDSSTHHRSRDRDRDRDRGRGPSSASSSSSSHRHHRR
ncbi:cyclophilin-16 [Salpingoeca rosetta]|uniref:Cyclophilin-16 n=1 Tax=Salpingoeca rosetta (strain ATCC 50818 / BSB-021) TaxID=946362 RepID=F2U0R9_SALR5|nr:cyclophilin-16 [Salpingoeca rosetta]EGD80493.1 cyclophilin-16 [Salpingoeca rosetta]|eukprot:XP_004997054.1 cyclophilin-16 [Salpingoeca rosetta]